MRDAIGNMITELFFARLPVPKSVGNLFIILAELLFPSRPEHVEADILNRKLEPGDIVLEVGARMGGSTRLISSLTGATGHVYSLEPNPYAFRMLSRTARLLGNATAIDVAAGSTKGVCFLQMDAPYDAGASIAMDRRWRKVKVPTLPLDDIVEKYSISRVSVLIIDVEGLEASVLKGASIVLNDIRVLVIELHPYVNHTIMREVEEATNAAGFHLVEKKVASVSPYIPIHVYEK